MSEVVRIPKEALELVDQYIQAVKEKNNIELSRGQAIAELIRKALNVKPQEQESHVEVQDRIEKLIMLRFPTKCTKCSRELNAGDMAMWVKYVFSDGTGKSYVYCLKCYHSEEVSVKEIAKLEIQKYKLREQIKELKKMKEQLLEELDFLTTMKMVDEELKKINEKVNEVLAKMTNDEFVKNSTVTYIMREIRFTLDAIYKRIEKLLSHAEEAKRKMLKHGVTPPAINPPKRTPW